MVIGNIDNEMLIVVYPVSHFSGEKWVMLSTGSWIGAKNRTLLPSKHIHTTTWHRCSVPGHRVSRHWWNITGIQHWLLDVSLFCWAVSIV